MITSYANMHGMVCYLDLPPPSDPVVEAGVDGGDMVDVEAGVFCGVGGEVNPRVEIL